MTDNAKKDLAHAKRVINHEIRALKQLINKLGDDFSQAVDMIVECEGRVVTTGMGKAGIIAQKTSATLASTGTPSHFLHPAEAVHGDLGRIVADDVVLAFSNSGETEEIVRLLPNIRKIGVKFICITSDRKSTIAKRSDCAVVMGRLDEACPLGLAPSASTTAMLAMGDALALTVLSRRNFNKEEFAFYHPGGSLGRQLMKVEEIMRPLAEIAVVETSASVNDAVLAISSGKIHRSGAACIVGRTGILKGIITDGDIRRHISDGKKFLESKIADAMTKSPMTVTKGSLAADAFKALKAKRIDELPVVDSRGKLVGMVDVQDLLDTVML